MLRFFKIVQVFSFFIVFFFSSFCSAQHQFYFKNSHHKKEKIPFKLINNVMVIPLKINGIQLSFIVDTGSDKTIVFKLNEKDTIGLQSTKKVNLQGLGNGEPVAAFISKNNTIEIEQVIGKNQTVYVILKDFFDLSSKMGTTIHGIIGHTFFKDFVVNINYQKKYVKLYQRAAYRKKICRKCEKLPLRIFRRKPYIKTKIQLDTIGNTLTYVELLIDTGGSDTVWLFEGTHDKIITPKQYFDDILGEGLSGPIYGKRSRLKKIEIGNFTIESPTASFLDASVTQVARTFKLRNGSLGGNILKRFKIWLDYKEKTIALKKNASFKKGFNYNMSGLDVVYNGKRLVRERVKTLRNTQYGQETSKRNSIFFETRYSFKFKPLIKISRVVPNSPAKKAGLKAGDVLLSLNRKPIYEYKLDEILYKFREKENKKIRVTVLRNSKEITFKFRLRKRI